MMNALIGLLLIRIIFVKAKIQSLRTSLLVFARVYEKNRRHILSKTDQIVEVDIKQAFEIHLALHGFKILSNHDLSVEQNHTPKLLSAALVIIQRKLFHDGIKTLLLIDS
jgi:hypothetical protein